MVKGILADVNVLGLIEYLAKLMQANPWAEFWKDLGLVLRHFDDVGLAATASDLEIWRRCQVEELILITDNRNDDSRDSLTAAIRDHGTANSLPVFTIADTDTFRKSRDYADRVVVRLYEYLLRIDSLRGAGRLYLP
jgi:hypothetical protein